MPTPRSIEVWPMTTLPELSLLLKPLRLSGILDSLEARNREAIDRHLAYTCLLYTSDAGRRPS